MVQQESLYIMEYYHAERNYTVVVVRGYIYGLGPADTIIVYLDGKILV